MKTLCAICVFAAALTALPAAAQPVWTTAATACVVDESNVGIYSLNDAELKFLEPNIGEIVARCNVTTPLDAGSGPPWTVMEVVYRDTDGPGLDSQVKVLLRRVNNAGASFTIAGFDSNAFPGGFAGLMNGTAVAHVFDFRANSYFVEIRLKRGKSGTQYAPAAFAVRLRS